MFKCDNIFDRPSTLFCKGVGERKHIFLAHEGHANCHHCKEVVCSYCQGSIGDNIFCLSCLATETIVPAHGSIEDKTILEMRAVELTSNDMSGYINPTVRMAARLGLVIGNASSFCVEGRIFFHANPLRILTYKNIKEDEPVVMLGMSDEEVKRLTGFPDEEGLLAYIFVICNGDINTINIRSSSLTWYEEWFLHCEYQWGRALTRVSGVKAVDGAKRNNTVLDVKEV
jgi:hypothetical protein